MSFLIQKCGRLVDVISALAGVKWGSHPSLLLTVYRSALRSVIEYGSMADLYGRFSGSGGALSWCSN